MVDADGVLPAPVAFQGLEPLSVYIPTQQFPSIILARGGLLAGAVCHFVVIALDATPVTHGAGWRTCPPIRHFRKKE